MAGCHFFLNRRSTPGTEHTGEELEEESVCLYYRWNCGFSSGCRTQPLENLLDVFLLQACLLCVCEEMRMVNFSCEDYYDETEDEWKEEIGNNPGMQLILELTADVPVVMPKDREERYYGHVFLEMVKQKGAILSKGISCEQGAKEMLSLNVNIPQRR